LAAIRNFVFALLRLLVTAGLLWGLATRLDLARAEAIIGRASLPWLAAALLALFATAPATAARWRFILAAGAPSPAIGSLVKLLFVGLFFNQVLPTGVGGDAVRAWRCRKLGVGLGVAIRSVLLDRASGYLVTLVVYAASLPALLRILSDAGERIGILAVFAAGLCGLLVVAVADFLPARLLRLPLFAALAELSREGRRLVAQPRRCAGVLGLSALTVGFPVLAYMLVGKSLGTDLPFGIWLMVVPPVTLIQLLPVSFAGWGIRELGLVVILAGFGVDGEAALAVSLLIGLSLIVVGLPGGLIWLTDWDLRGAAETEPAATGLTGFRDRGRPAA
jgi:glycosyltransferase 2 family protein